MKRRIFLVRLYCFSRLQIYESIAAFFWQSASYVLICLPLFCYDHLITGQEVKIRLFFVTSSSQASECVTLFVINCS